ncbi:MAG: DUF4469 domain-containing protein [Prevotellaceae bacterium]|jgi:hypothetical protein|nr:DUF4469 domain-containing protein [Prevotellaceae bacterium]
MLQYSLIENLLTSTPGDYLAQPTNVRSYTLLEIFQRISARYPGLTPTQISSAVNEFFGEVTTITENGETVTTPLFNTQLSMPGIYNGAMDSFDAKRHSVKINLNPGVLMREAVRKVKTEKVATAESLPHILEVKDVTSGMINDTITPGGVIQLRGSKLRFLTDQPENGIFLFRENEADIVLTTIVENKPARLIAVLPTDLPHGEYFIEVRTTFSGSAKPAKKLKRGRYNKILTVV